MSLLFRTYIDEFKRLFRNWPAFSVLIAAAAIYAAFYPQPYRLEALHKVPIAVVDQDRTTASRELVRRLEAASDVIPAVMMPDLASATAKVFAREVYGVLLIPEHFERDLLHRRPSPLSLYGDASYFIIYHTASHLI